MNRRPYNGILGLAAMIAGLGVDLTPPPPREPEPTEAELDAMFAALTAAGIDAGRLAADVHGWPREFMRRGQAELAARALGKVDSASPPETASCGGKLVHAGLDGSIDLSRFKPGQRVTIGDSEGRTLAHMTIGAGGGAGDCAWCVMDRRRESRAEASERNRREGLELRKALRPQQTASRRARARVKARRGW